MVRVAGCVPWRDEEPRELRLVEPLDPLVPLLPVDPLVPRALLEPREEPP